MFKGSRVQSENHLILCYGCIESAGHYLMPDFRRNKKSKQIVVFTKKSIKTVCTMYKSYGYVLIIWIMKSIKK